MTVNPKIFRKETDCLLKSFYKGVKQYYKEVGGCLGDIKILSEKFQHTLSRVIFFLINLVFVGEFSLKMPTHDQSGKSSFRSNIYHKR